MTGPVADRTPMGRLLELENVSKSFGGLMALAGVDLYAGEGEILGLIGPNGSGKTTLFNVIAGVYRPDGGRIAFDGADITGRGPAEVCLMGIARTFQVTRPFPLMSVLDNVRLGRAYGRKPAATLEEATAEAREILGFIGLSGKADAPAGRLGLIDRKRLELGKALATRPRLLLLDEIMAGLNPTEVAAATELVRRVRDSGVTVIVIEHMMRAILGMSSRVVVLASGRKIAEGTPGDVVADRGVVEAYLGVDEDEDDEAAC